MNTPASPPGAERTDGSPVQIGALVPLTRPGWVEAGRHLLAGLELGARDVNDAGGIGGRPLELVVRDTAADPRRAAAAVDELARLGVAALAGEYHSVVARAAAARADALGLPFLCSSAVLDALTEEPTEWVARLAPTAVGDELAGGRATALLRRLRGLRHGRRPRRPAAFSRRGPGRRGRTLAARRRRGHPRADSVLPPARHQRLAMGAGASPGRRPGSGGTRSLPDPARRLSVPGAGGPGRHGAARTARPGRASLTSRASRTTRVPFTRTCRMPVVGRVLAE